MGKCHPCAFHPSSPGHAKGGSGFLWCTVAKNYRSIPPAAAADGEKRLAAGNPPPLAK